MTHVVAARAPLVAAAVVVGETATVGDTPAPAATVLDAANCVVAEFWGRVVEDALVAFLDAWSFVLFEPGDGVLGDVATPDSVVEDPVQRHE